MSSDARFLDPAALTTQSLWLRRLAHQLTRDSAFAEDAAQDALVEAIARPPRGLEPGGPWLVAVLRNVVRKHLRTARRRLLRESAAPGTDAPATPEDLLARHEAQRLLAELVSGLAEPYRTTVLLRYAEDLAPTEIARRQGVPAGTVRWRLNHALAELRTRLEHRHGGARRLLAVLAPTTSKARYTSGLRLTVALASLGLIALLIPRQHPDLQVSSRSADAVSDIRQLSRAPAPASALPVARAPAPASPPPRFLVSPPLAEPSSDRPSRPPEVLPLHRRHDFTPDELILLASNCELRNDLPGMKTRNDIPQGWMQDRDLEALGLTAGERPVVWQAMQRFRADVNESVRRLYVAVTGHQADAHAVDLMDHQDENNPRTGRLLRQMDARHFMDGARIVAEELAGLEPAATRFDARLVSLAADHYRRQRVLVDDYERRIAAALGPERARQIRRHPVAGRTRRAWCP